MILLNHLPAAEAVGYPQSPFRSWLLAGQCDFARARDFLHAERIHQADEFLHLAFGAGDFNGDRFRLHVHDFGAENVRDLHHLGACLGVHRHLDQHQLAVHVFALVEILHLDDIRQLVELLDDLLQRGLVAVGDDGHARRLGVLRRADVEGVNVVAAAAEQPGHAREHAELVLDQN